jgi:dysferlin
MPIQSLIRIQIWDWDLASVNDKIAETSIDVENRWLSCHRPTCALPKRYDRFIDLKKKRFYFYELF